jgi:beta-lactam-binding protein with PASTA domain
MMPGMRRLPSTIIALLVLIVVVGCNGTEELVAVPDVIGLNEVEAVERLDAAGFNAAATADWEADETHGTVVEQDPVPGSRVEAGTTITLAVARDES